MEHVRITKVRLDGFRNHSLLDFEPSSSVTVLVGRNAAGKTNILEGIALTTSGSSFRKYVWEDTVRKGRERARVDVEAEREGSTFEVSLLVEKSGARTFLVNGIEKRKTSEVFGRIPTVTFVPDDLQIVKGTAEARRDAVDALGARMSAPYATLRREYARIVKQRNTVLRNGHSTVELEVWTERLAEVGSAFFVHRARLANRIADGLASVYRGLSGGERAALAVECSWDGKWRSVSEMAETRKEDVRARLFEALREAQGKERERGVSLIGPHRDDLILTIDDMASRAFASQGQQRSLVLAWKMAEVGVVREVTGLEPVLLLDDVMSELDEERRGALQRFIQGGPQTVMTTTTLSYFEQGLLSGALVLGVGENG